nr:hypothetical protein [Tanacetum cinerariifolium]
MKENCVYTLDGWDELGEASVDIQEKKSLAQCGINAWDTLGEFWLRSLHDRGSYRLCPCGSLGSFSGGVDEWFLSGLPDLLWAEVTVMAAYVINRFPYTTLEKKTLMDLWSGHLANYEMLRKIGCVVYLHVNQRKLKPRAIKCIFLRILSRVLVLQILERKLSLRWNFKAVGSNQLWILILEKIQGMKMRNKMKGLNNRIWTTMFWWVRAMEEEMSYLKKNHTWELFNQPHGQKLVSCKWLYMIKEWIEGVQKPRYKAMLVARGFTQRVRINYNEVFSLVVRHTSIRVILSLTDNKDYELEQLDVKTAFLHVSKIQDSGIKDDMLIACKSKSAIEYTKGLLRKEFDIKELGPTRKILDMKFVRDRSSRTLKVSQSGYMQKFLNNYIIDNGKSVSVPLGAHFKVSLKDCPLDITYVVSIMSRYLENPEIKGSIWMLTVLWMQIMLKTLKRAETKYMALTKAVKESIWLKGLLIEMGKNLRLVVVNCENQRAIHLSRNVMFYKRVKHINVRYHFIKEIMESREIEVAKIGT